MFCLAFTVLYYTLPYFYWNSQLNFCRGPKLLIGKPCIRDGQQFTVQLRRCRGQWEAGGLTCYLRPRHLARWQGKTSIMCSLFKVPLPCFNLFWSSLLMLICSNRGVLSEHRLHYKGVAQGWGDTDAHEQSCERKSSQSGLAIAALALCKTLL